MAFPGARLEHLPEQAVFLVGFNVFEPVSNLPHHLQIRLSLADGVSTLKPRYGAQPAIGEHFLVNSLRLGSAAIA